ncbi:MAG TPA: HNH endonuclease [Ktedonobacteraceae bacterium]|nr:HNH endonuclease [Ktedonobacteraceae bacterium]
MKRFWHMLTILTIFPLLLLILSGCNITVTAPTTGSTPTSGTGNQGVPNFGVQTKTSCCVAHNGLPDSTCTPGAILSTGTKAAICQPGYSRSVRNVPTSVKDQAYAEYGITTHTTGQYEVDHLVSLELGGSNDISNLWPEAASPKPGFHEKDKVENYLHDQVCSGAIDLKQAQIEIATNWLNVYNQMPNK